MHRTHRRGGRVPAAIAALIVLGGAPALAAGPFPAETCGEIRALIGLLPPANADLLRKLAARKECGFTSGEVYQAAYGDRPLVTHAPGRRHYRTHDDDD